MFALGCSPFILNAALNRDYSTAIKTLILMKDC